MNDRFAYDALDAQGQQLSGTLNAASVREAARQLQRQGLTVMRLEPVAVQAPRKARTAPAQRELLLTMYELATLLEAGVPIIDAVSSLARSSHHPGITAAFAEIEGRLRKGETFSAAFAAGGLKLPPYFQQLAAAGEMTGKLAQALRDAVQQMEYDYRLSSEIRGALVYPSILIVSGIAAVLLIFIIVVPKFGGMLSGRNTDLHWLAWAVLSTGMWFNRNVMLVTGGAVGLALGASYTFAKPAVRRQLLELVARLPLIGSWLVEAETGRWAATLGTLLENRVDLLQALDLARDQVGFRFLRSRLTQVSKAVRGGTSLSDALRDSSALTASGQDLVRVGEQSGELPMLLRALARLYEASGRDRMKRAVQLIEPLAILIIGGAIGVIITGVVLAITGTHNIGI